MTSNDILNRLVGHWSGQEAVTAPGAAEGRAKFTYCENVMVLSDRFVQSLHVQHDRQTGALFLNLLLYGAADDGSITFHRFDSQGRASHAPARGQASGDSFVYFEQDEHGVRRYTYQFPDRDTYLFRAETLPRRDSTAGRVLVEGEFRRVR